MKLFKKCIRDKDCKEEEHCDHGGFTAFNPVGDCKAGRDEKARCIYDRQCKSKKCRFFRCKGAPATSSETEKNGKKDPDGDGKY
jgi:hypothetical protein